MNASRFCCVSLCVVLAACAGTVERPVGQQPRCLLAASLFEQGNAQLKVTALKPLAEQATLIAVRDAGVTHIIAIAPDADALELAERRAATLAGFFLLRGIAPARLRYESRVVPDGDAAVVIVIAPMAQGSESQAWMPPNL